MNCPKCGYVLSPTDIECPRCKKIEEGYGTKQGALKAKTNETIILLVIAFVVAIGVCILILMNS